MVYTARALITDSFYISGISALDTQTVSGGQISQGLTCLNDCLASASMNSGINPYTVNYYNGTFVPGQEIYEISGLMTAETLTYYIDNVRYSMEKLNRDNYFGAPRIENINTLPAQWFLERTDSGANIYVYYFPQQAYTFALSGCKFYLPQVLLDTDISQYFENAYIVFLKYYVAYMLASRYSVSLTPDVMDMMKRLEKSIKNVSLPDLTANMVSLFPGAFNVPNYANATLARGWIPIKRY